MSSPPQNPWPAVLPWLIAGIALFTVAAVGGFGAAYLLSTGQAVATVDPARLPTPTPPPTPTPGLATPSPATTPGPTITSSPAAPASPTPEVSASPTEPGGPSPSPISYTVKRGDRLRDIAAQFGVTVDAIVQLNNLENPDRIEAGQVLLIPLP
jgi:LysM repeat protein